MKHTRPGSGVDDERNDALKRILSAAIARAPVASTSIPEAAIRAYLDGRATAEQKNEIRRAMTSSRDVADEILSHFQARQDLDDSRLQRRMAAVQVPIEDLIARMKERSERVASNGIVHSGVLIRPAQWMWQPYAGCSLDMTA
ncbi:MAG: hypothetical protein IPK64_00205 [bacterium]|nr:hypothetical protein [bacterium]